MKVSKYVAVACLLVAAMMLVPAANAQPTTILAGAGSTAIFNALYDAAATSGACGTNLWSAKAGTYPAPFGNKGGTVHDNRVLTPAIPDDNNKVWVAFNGTNAANYTDTTTICFYIAVDSGVGVRAFLAAPRGTLFLGTIQAGQAGASQVKGYTDSVNGVANGPLPQAIRNDITYFGSACAGTILTTCTTVTGVPINFAGTDIRPEDAQYSTYRALSARPYTGVGFGPSNAGYFNSTNLGYGNWTSPYDAGSSPVFSGTSILSSFSTTAATPTYFEEVPGIIDSISGQAVGQYEVQPIGAVPIIIAVSNSDTGTCGLGVGNPGPYAVKNVDKFV